MRVLLVKQHVATCLSLSFLFQENGNLVFLLHIRLPRQMSQKRNYKQILYHLVGQPAPVCFPSKRGTQGLGIQICMHSQRSSSLFPYSLTSLNLCLFCMHPSLSLLTFMRLVQCVIHKSCVPSFNFNSSTFIALMTVSCGSILEDCFCIVQQQVLRFCWLCKQSFWFCYQLCAE